MFLEKNMSKHVNQQKTYSTCVKHHISILNLKHDFIGKNGVTQSRH